MVANLAIDTMVKLHGLVNAPSLNGRTGTVTGYCENKDRFSIMVDGVGKWFKSSNLALQCPACDKFAEYDKSCMSERCPLRECIANPPRRSQQMGSLGPPTSLCGLPRQDSSLPLVSDAVKQES